MTREVSSDAGLHTSNTRSRQYGSWSHGGAIDGLILVSDRLVLVSDPVRVSHKTVLASDKASGVSDIAAVGAFAASSEA